MNAYIIWLIIMIGAMIIEASTATLVCIWFACGALASIISVALGANAMVQIAVFVIVTGAALAATKPLVRKIQKNKYTPTNADKLIGETGIVTDDITEDKFAGTVKIRGKEWSAVTADKSTVQKGQQVRVESIEGSKLVVVVGGLSNG